MQLYIKQKVFSWRGRFAVKDTLGDDRWYAQGEVFSWVRKLNVYAAQGEPAATVYRKRWTFLTQEYYIEAGGQEYRLVKEFTFGRPRFHLVGLPWHMTGNFWAHEYSLTDGERLIMRISKRLISWGDTYELEIPDPRHELLCLCICLAVDCMQADANNHA